MNPEEDDDRQKRQIEKAKQVGKRIRENAQEYYKSLSPEEQAEIDRRLEILNVEGKENTPAREIFRLNAPWLRDLPVPRAFGHFRSRFKELLEQTWDEFKKKVENGTDNLLEERLRSYQTILEGDVDKLYEDIKNYGPIREIEDEIEQGRFMEWYRTTLPRPHRREYKPPAWKTFHPTIREYLILMRRKIQRIEDAITSISFRLAVLERVKWAFFVWGGTPSWKDLDSTEKTEMQKEPLMPPEYRVGDPRTPCIIALYKVAKKWKEAGVLERKSIDDIYVEAFPLVPEGKYKPKTASAMKRSMQDYWTKEKKSKLEALSKERTDLQDKLESLPEGASPEVKERIQEKLKYVADWEKEFNKKRLNIQTFFKLLEDDINRGLSHLL